MRTVSWAGIGQQRVAATGALGVARIRSSAAPVPHPRCARLLEFLSRWPATAIVLGLKRYVIRSARIRSHLCERPSAVGALIANSATCARPVDPDSVSSRSCSKLMDVGTALIAHLDLATANPSGRSGGVQGQVDLLARLAARVCRGPAGVGWSVPTGSVRHSFPTALTRGRSSPPAAIRLAEAGVGLRRSRRDFDGALAR
jgi:hypothetical protein